MFSASCSPVKISRSKQINAIFITIRISGTVIIFQKVAAWHQTLVLKNSRMPEQPGEVKLYSCLDLLYCENEFKRTLK